MKKLSAVVAFTLILLTSLSFTTPHIKGVEVESGSFVPINLYFHTNNTMNTTLPSIGEERKASLKDGQSITFISPDLDEELTVDTVCGNVSFYLEIKVRQVNTDLPWTPENEDVNETVDVKLSFSLENPDLSAEATEFFEKIIEWSGWKTVNLTFDKTGKVALGKNSNLTLSISSKVYPSSMLAKNYSVTLYYDEANYASHLSFSCLPVVATITTEGDTEFKPYAPTREIVFTGSIKDAFGDDDLKEVKLEIKDPYGSIVSPLDLKGLATKTGSYECVWNYTNNSRNLKAGNHTATLTVTTHQHIFYRATNFTFIACALDSGANRTSATILVGKSAGYAISIKNTGSFDVKITLNISFDIQVIPSGSHLWNITVFDKDTGSSIGNVSTYESRSLYYNIYNFYGGSTKNLILTVTSSETIPPNVDWTGWKCGVYAHARSITPEYPEAAPALTIFTYIAAPFEIDIAWAKKYDYPLVNRRYQFELNVTNLGSNIDSVNLTLNYTNKVIWNISLKKELVENLAQYGLPGYYSIVKINVEANSTYEELGEAPTVINITAESVYAPPEYKAKWTNKTLKYLILELRRAIGISLFYVDEKTKDVDVKVSSGQAQYKVYLETNDNIPHKIKLNATAESPLTATLETPEVEVSKATRKEVILTVTAPKGTLAGSYVTTIRGGIMVEGVVSPEHTKTISVTTVVNAYYGMDIVWLDENKGVNITASPSEVIDKKIKVTNKGNAPINVKLRMSVNGVSYAGLNDTEELLQPLTNNIWTVKMTWQVPGGAEHGRQFMIEVTGEIPGVTSETITLRVTTEKTEIERLWEVLARMAHFIILLIAVIIVFVALWMKRRK
ncbi:MAG: hypothetical protein AB1485_02145 [Candidatus Thermoplasmatota archaeon]